MATISSFAVFGFTILCLACVLNALEDDFGRNHDDSSNDLADSPSASFNSPSYTRSPSTGSNEEKENLKSSDDKSTRNKGQDMLFFDEESNIWNMKNFFRYFTNLVYGINENDDDFLDTSMDNPEFKMQNSPKNDFADKSESNGQTEKPKSGSNDVLNNSEDNGQMQKSETDTLSKPKNDEKVQNSENIDSQRNSDDEKIFFDEESNLWNMKKFYQYFANLLYAMNKNNGGSLDISTDDTKFKMQNSPNNNFADKSENNGQTEKSKPETGDALNNSEDDGNVKRPRTDTQSKSKDDENAQKSRNTVTLSNSDDVKEPKSGTTYISNKLNDNEQKEDSENAATQNESNDSEKMDDLTNEDGLNKSPDGGKMQNVSNSTPINRKEPSKTLKTKAQDSMDKDAVNKSGKSEKAEKQNLENIDTPNKPTKDLTEIPTKHYDVCDADDIIFDEDEEVNEVDNDVEKKNDLSEKDLNEDETEDDYETDNTYEDETEVDFVNDNNSNNETDSNPNIKNENINENNYDNDRNKLANSSQNLPAENITNEAAPNTSFTLPKFLTQVIQGPQNYSTSQPSEKKKNNIDVTTPAVTESQNPTSQEKILQEYQLNNNEFIDSYVNNPYGETIDRKNGDTEGFIPNRNNSKSGEVPVQIPMIENNYENNTSVNATSPTDENMEDVNMPYNKSQNTLSNFTLENNSNNVPLNKSSPPENIQNISASDNIPVSSFEEDNKTGEIKPLNSTPLEEMPNAGMINDFDQTQKTSSEQNVVSDIQNQDSPNTSNKVMYVRNYESELSNNPQNIKMPPTNTEMPSNYLISNDLQPYSTINPINNTNYPTADMKNNINDLDKNVSQDQIDEMKLRNQSNDRNNKEILNQQTESANQPLQEKLTEPQQLSSQNDINETPPQNATNNDNKMSSEIFPTQNDSNDASFLQSQNGTNSNRLPQDSFNTTEDGLSNNNSENKTSFPDNIIPDKPEGQDQEAPNSNSNNGNSNKSPNLHYDNEDAKKVDEKMTGFSGQKNPGENEIQDGYMNENNDEGETNDEDEANDEDENEEEDKTENETEKEDKNKNEEEVESGGEGEEEVKSGGESEEEVEGGGEGEEEVEGGGEGEGEEEEREEEEKYEDAKNNEDRSENSYDYGGNKDKNSQNSQIEITDERTDDNITTRSSTTQRISGEQSYSETQPAMYQINNNDDITAIEDNKSRNKINEESPMQIIQKNPTRIENDATKQQEFESGLPPSNQEGNFDTILEYIYKYSNNPFFKAIKEEREQAS